MTPELWGTTAPIEESGTGVQILLPVVADLSGVRAVVRADWRGTESMSSPRSVEEAKEIWFQLIGAHQLRADFRVGDLIATVSASFAKELEVVRKAVDDDELACTALVEFEKLIRASRLFNSGVAMRYFWTMGQGELRGLFKSLETALSHVFDQNVDSPEELQSALASDALSLLRELPFRDRDRLALREVVYAMELGDIAELTYRIDEYALLHGVNPDAARELIEAAVYTMRATRADADSESLRGSGTIRTQSRAMRVSSLHEARQRKHLRDSTFNALGYSVNNALPETP